jgi:hypothetical protein
MRRLWPPQRQQVRRITGVGIGLICQQQLLAY